MINSLKQIHLRSHLVQHLHQKTARPLFLLTQSSLCAVENCKNNFKYHLQIKNNQTPTIPLLKVHLFIQSLEKDGHEWFRGDSAIPAAAAQQGGSQLRLELTHTGALAPSEERKERGGGSKGGETERACKKGKGSCWDEDYIKLRRAKEQKGKRLTAEGEKKRGDDVMLSQKTVRFQQSLFTASPPNGHPKL